MSHTRSGQTIGKYKLLELLGRGGMAEVYKGYQENLDRHVAIKIMHSFLASEPDFLRRFEREARAMASLNHPNIVGVYDFDIINDTYYIVMEYLSEGSLKEELERTANRGEKLPLQLAVRYTLEIADALAYAHGRGMFHRDIKPANIMISERNSAVLTDFGIAKMVSGPSHTATGSMIGTPAYMSPEQGLGKPGDLRSDIYALGVLFFQMATGRMPYDADTPLGIVMKHVNDPIPNPSQYNTALPVQIRDVIVKAMAKDPAERFQTAFDFARALRAAVREGGVAAIGSDLPAALLQDRPTPPPPRYDPTPLPSQIGGLDATRVAGRADATQVAGGHQATQIAPRVDRTEVVSAPKMAAPESRKRRLWPWVVGIGLLLTLVVAGVGLAGSLGVFGGGAATPTPAAVVVADDTATPTPESATATVESNENGGVMNAATINAELTMTAAALPTGTRLPVTPSPTVTATATASPTPSETPDLTATFVADCSYDATLVQWYTYNNTANNGVFEDVTTFPLRFEIENTGSCDILAGTILANVDGASFGDAEAMVLDATLAPGESILLSTDAAVPGPPGTYPTTWQVADSEGNAIGEAFEIVVRVFQRVTLTPTLPPESPTPVATEEPEQALNFNWQVLSCEYIGSRDYLCSMEIVPYGGGGSPYSVFATSTVNGDVSVPVDGNGRALFNFSRDRCSGWTGRVQIVDASSRTFALDISFSPSSRPDLFPDGGCTEP